MLCPVVKALLGHYRRYPLQLILVWLGLTLGVSLFVGVTAIAEHTRKSYEHGEKFFANPLPYHIRSDNIDQPIPFSLYIQLRRAGFSQCAPFASYRATTRRGLNLLIIGVDPILSLPKPASIPGHSYPVIISKELAKREKLTNGDWMMTESGVQLGPIQIDQKNLVYGSKVITALPLVQALKGNASLSVIACADMPYVQLKHLKSILPEGINISRGHRSDIGSLTKAFLLNLNAMGMLSFMVGLFIFYQAISLSFIQRQPLVGMLRQAGVSGLELTKSLAIEIALLILVSCISGNILGMILANQFIPVVYSALANESSETYLWVAWNWRWGVYSVLLATISASCACVWPLIRLLKSPSIRLTPRVSLIRFAGAEFAIQAVLAVILLLVATAVYFLVKAACAGFIVPALILLSVGLITPYIVWKVFDLLSYTLKDVKRRWFFSDAAASMGYRGIATMAFLIALTANIGVETLIGSFRETTDRWLNERLAADLYVYSSPSSQKEMTDWLVQQDAVQSLWKRWERDIPSDQGLLQIVSTGKSSGELNTLTVKVAVPNFWELLHTQRSIMISESMSLKLDIRPGDVIQLPPPLGLDWKVAGIYYDYGNPFYQVMIAEPFWHRLFGYNGNIVLNITAKPEFPLARLRKEFEQTFHIDEERVFDNKTIHQALMKTFDRTFAIAGKLGRLTLFIAVVGIFFATLAGEVTRQKHMTLLRCLGVSGKELVVIGSIQLCIFGAISLFIAIPLGIALASLVIDIVIKQAFGWSIQLYLIPQGYLETSLWSLTALVAAGAIPILRLVLQAPMRSLRDAL
ncbi:ABC transporter permease [Vibrio quintilis]|uniref:FtsX-like permease family protein n=1 Tax=Vibrio quintilis TaxID=1117707 RepID=A0A1M7YV16_9VIBR|nr:ABC transporter permease [Vibrio quintilis]SHO56401.1 FtsX-like permease family protein [Vibrio quintilis]